MIHRHEIRVRYGETDKMGVVHHSVYPLYFEEARTELMRAIGRSYRELEDDGFLLPLTDIGMRFLRGPRYDDVLILESRLVKVTKVRLNIEYRVYRKGDGLLLAEGFTHHASTNRDLKPRRLPEDVHLAFFGAIEPTLSEDPARDARPKESGGLAK